MSSTDTLTCQLQQSSQEAQVAFEKALAVAGPKSAAQELDSSELLNALEIAHQLQRFAEATLDTVVQLVDETKAARSINVTTGEVLSNIGGYSTKEANRIILRAKRRRAHPGLHAAWARNDVTSYGLSKSINTIDELKDHLSVDDHAALKEEVTQLAGAKMDNKSFDKELTALANRYWAKVEDQPSAEEKLHPKRGVYFKRIDGGWNINATVTTEVGDAIRNALGDKARKLRVEQNQAKRRPDPIQARLADSLGELCRDYIARHLPDVKRLHPVDVLPQDAAGDLIRTTIAKDYDGRYDRGREARFATAQLRALVLARDGGCLFPHCTAIPTTCEIAHVVPWKLGGHTNLDNLIALCPHHHWIFDQANTDPSHRYRVEKSRGSPPRIIPPPTLQNFGGGDPPATSPPR